MKRNNFFSRFIVVTLTAALLLVSGSRAIRVSALAELAPEVAPVFDTQIYQLQDYIDHGGMTDPQLDIFYMLCGFYALGQAGSEDYKITNPYSTQGGVLNWLKDVGVETYNTLIGLTPDTVVLPNGSIQSTDVLKKAASMYVANLMGCALKAVDYDTVQEFEDDINNSENFYIPWNKATQYGLNTMFQTYGGIYNWQFDSSPFTTTHAYNTRTMTGVQQSQWNTYRNAMIKPVRVNPYYSNTTDTVFDLGTVSSYHNLFFNTTSNNVKIYDDSGNAYYNLSLRVPALYFNSANQIFYNSSEEAYFMSVSKSWNLSSYNTYQEGVQALYDSAWYKISSYDSSFSFIFLEDFIEHVYIGSSWATRSEIFNLVDLNFDDDSNSYYVAPPDENDYLLDIKGILQDILNNTNLYNVFIDNIYTPDGVLVHDTDLIRITTDIYDLLNQQNPPLPVNLNDISDYTDNTYLDRLKEHAKNFGDIFAAYVAFWHNADHDLVYTIFGASIMVLIGAFIGKWGHS